MRLTFWQYVAFFTLPTLAYLALAGLIASALMLRLSPWLAVPLGLILGAVVSALWVTSQEGASTVVELNISCIIFLTLLGFLVPVIIKVRHNRLHPHHRTHHPPAAHSAAPQQKTLP